MCCKSCSKLIISGRFGTELGTAEECLCLFQMCLEMVIALSLRNRDRLLLIWPLVHEFLAAVLAPQGEKR